MLYGPEYTGLIQVSGLSVYLSTHLYTSILVSFASHICLKLFSIRLKFGAMAIGSLSTLMTGICSSSNRNYTITGRFSKALPKVASEKRWLLLCSLFRSKGVLGNFLKIHKIKTLILSCVTRSTIKLNQVALIEKAYAKIHGSYEVNIN